MQAEQSPKPWYKHPWAWFVIALPASVVVASISTYFIAMKGLDPVITKDYYKEGLAVNTDLTLEKNAINLGLHAQVSIDNQTVTVKLAAKDAATLSAMRGSPIQFELENLSFQAANVNSLLMPVGVGEWRGQLEGKVSQATWSGRLIGPNWRISQRLENIKPVQFELKP